MLPTGKLAPHILRSLLSSIKVDQSVQRGAAYGEDAAAVRFADKVLVAAADPVTFACDSIGSYAVAVNANDVAVCGAVPRYFLATILLPTGSSKNDAAVVFEHIEAACENLGVSLIGGHTEVTGAVTTAIVSGCLLGEADPHRLISTSGAQIGDYVILTESAGLEGAALLARDAADDLTKAGVNHSVVATACSFLDSPGICVVRHCRIALQSGVVSAMHDPTEGGVATALHELASASGTGIRVSRDRIRVRKETEVICQSLGLDPLGLVSSGSLLICASPETSSRCIADLEAAGIYASVVGCIVEPSLGVRFDDGEAVCLFERDEIARYFEQRD